MIPQRFQRLLTQMDNAQQEFLAVIHKYSEEQQRFRTHESAWSMLDVLNHLKLAEEGVYEFVAVKRDPARMPERSSWHQPLRALAMMTALKSPFRFRAPSRVKSPATNRALEELETEWLQARAKLRDFVQNLSPALWDAPLFIHPFFGYLNISHTMRFIRDHTAHHIRQLHRIAGATNFPSN